MFINYLCVLGSISMTVLMWSAERSSYKRNMPGPATLFLAVLTLSFLVTQSKLYVFEHSADNRAALTFLIFNVCYGLGAILVTKFRAPHGVFNDDQRVVISFNRIFIILLFLSLCGVGFAFTKMFIFGFTEALQNMANYHTWNHRLGSEYSNLERFFVTLVGFPQSIVFCLSIILRKNLPSYLLKLAYYIYAPLYLLQVMLLQGRGALITSGVVLSFVYIFSSGIKLTKKVKYRIISALLVVGIVAFLATLRRVQSFDKEGAYNLMDRYNIIENRMPEQLLLTRPGILFTHIWCYIGSPYNNYALITKEIENIAPSWGTRSIRLMNPMLGLINRQLALEQKKRFEDNMLILRSYFVSARQWPTAWGYMLIDFGLFGTLIASFSYGLFHSLLTRAAFRLCYVYRILVMVVSYSWAFSSFVMPFTAMYSGFAALTFALTVIFGARTLGALLRKKFRSSGMDPKEDMSFRILSSHNLE